MNLWEWAILACAAELAAVIVVAMFLKGAANVAPDEDEYWEEFFAKLEDE